MNSCKEDLCSPDGSLVCKGSVPPEECPAVSRDVERLSKPIAALVDESRRTIDVDSRSTQADDVVG